MWFDARQNLLCLISVLLRGALNFILYYIMYVNLWLGCSPIQINSNQIEEKKIRPKLLKKKNGKRKFSRTSALRSRAERMKKLRLCVHVHSVCFVHLWYKCYNLLFLLVCIHFTLWIERRIWSKEEEKSHSFVARLLTHL